MPARDTTIFLTSWSGTPCCLSDDRNPSEAKTSISPFWTEKCATEGVDKRYGGICLWVAHSAVAVGWIGQPHIVLNTLARSRESLRIASPSAIDKLISHFRGVAYLAWPRAVPWFDQTQSDHLRGDVLSEDVELQRDSLNCASHSKGSPSKHCWPCDRDLPECWTSSYKVV